LGKNGDLAVHARLTIFYINIIIQQSSFGLLLHCFFFLFKTLRCFSFFSTRYTHACNKKVDSKSLEHPGEELIVETPRRLRLRSSLDMRRNLYRHGGNSSSPRSQSSSSLLLLLIFIALLFSIDPSAAANVDDHWRRSAALVVSLDSHSRFTAVRAQNVVTVGKETLADERDGALLAVEMLIVPMAVFE